MWDLRGHSIQRFSHWIQNSRCFRTCCWWCFLFWRRNEDPSRQYYDWGSGCRMRWSWTHWRTRSSSQENCKQWVSRQLRIINSHGKIIGYSGLRKRSRPCCWYEYNCRKYHNKFVKETRSNSSLIETWDNCNKDRKFWNFRRCFNFCSNDN